MSSNVTPVVTSQGHFTGNITGAEVVLLADINYQKLVNDLEGIAAQYAATLANDQNQIQQLTLSLEQGQYQKDGIQAIEDLLHDNQPLSDTQRDALQDYQSQLNIFQSEGQAATKAIDPVLTTEQNQPSALQQGANEFIQEVGTLNQGLQALANDRIG